MEAAEIWGRAKLPVDAFEPVNAVRLHNNHTYTFLYVIINIEMTRGQTAIE